MIGAITVGKKAAKYGYRKYGVPGAVVAGAGGVAAVVAVRNVVESRTETDDTDEESPLEVLTNDAGTGTDA